MTDYPTIVMIAGIFLTNLSIILAAWIKMKTDITAINVQLKALDFRVSDMEQDHSENVKEIHLKMEKFTEINGSQHDIISNKIDLIKDSIASLKVDIAKSTK
jgi:hypothetical protein